MSKTRTPYPAVFREQIIALLASALLDRFLHHATTVNIKGESYRLKEKRRAGFLTCALPQTLTKEESSA